MYISNQNIHLFYSSCWGHSKVLVHGQFTGHFYLKAELYIYLSHDCTTVCRNFQSCLMIGWNNTRWLAFWQTVIQKYNQARTRWCWLKPKQSLWSTKNLGGVICYLWEFQGNLHEKIGMYNGAKRVVIAWQLFILTSIIHP